MQVSSHSQSIKQAMEPYADSPYRTLSDLYVTVQLVADNKPLTIPFRTSFKAFKNNYRLVLSGIWDRIG